MMLYTQIAGTEPAGTEMTRHQLRDKYQVSDSKIWSALHVLEKTGAVSVKRRKGLESVFRFMPTAVELIAAYEEDVALRRRLPKSDDCYILSGDTDEWIRVRKHNGVISVFTAKQRVLRKVNGVVV